MTTFPTLTRVPDDVNNGSVSTQLPDGSGERWGILKPK